MQFKKILKFISTLIIFSLCLIKANAVDFTLKINSPEESFPRQSEVRIPITAEKISPCDFLKPFHLEINYDHNVFDFKEFACNFPFSENEFKINENDSSLTILSNFQKIVNLPFQNREFLLGDIVLFVKDSAPCGKHSVDCTFNQDRYYKKIKSSAEINILPASESSSMRMYLSPETIKNQKNKIGEKLKSIIPEIGTLSPSFDPNTFEYSVDVGEDVQYLEINAEPLESDCSVKISRRKLLAAGRTTPIKIIVSGKNGKTIYIVKVNRAAKAGSKNSSGKRKNSEKSSNKKQRKSKNKNGQNQYDEDDDYEDEGDEEENENDGENQIIKDENNSKIYLIVVLGVIILVCIGYYTYKFIKYKRKNSKNIKNSLNKPLK